MKVSIIIAIYNSHKVVIRQIRHFRKMNLLDDVEIIFIDDGSEPPINYWTGMKNFRWLYTHDKRPWTQGLARNMGATEAKGEYLFFTDIDHIITREAIEAVRNFTEDKMVFRRKFGFFDRRGNILSDEPNLIRFGANPKYKRRDYYGGIHGNTFAIRGTIFFEIGGYNPKYCESGFHVGGKYMSEERNFNIRWQHRIGRGKSKPEVGGPDIYVYPVGKFHKDGNQNPGGLFHSLSYEQVPQPCKA